MPTTITIDPAVRDRLKRYGHAGMTYNEILTRMMDEIEREAFVADLRRQAAELKEEDLVDLEDLDEEFYPKPRPKGASRASRAAPGRQARRPASPSRARGGSHRKS